MARAKNRIDRGSISRRPSGSRRNTPSTSAQVCCVRCKRLQQNHHCAEEVSLFGRKRLISGGIEQKPPRVGRRQGEVHGHRHVRLCCMQHRCEHSAMAVFNIGPYAYAFRNKRGNLLVARLP